MTMIELRCVSKTVSSAGQPLTILQPTDLVVEPGEFLSVVGASGSGKSTLLGLIAGLDTPSSGEILIDGIEITGLDEDRLARLRGAKIGFVFQFFHLIPSLSAFENILVPLEIAGEAGAREKAEELLDDVGLTARGHHYPAQLSGGEQQRVAIARALANNPPILLADEPTGNLDSSTGHQVIDLLVDINRAKGMTIVMVTHDVELTNRSNRVLSMRDGKTESTQLMTKDQQEEREEATDDVKKTLKEKSVDARINMHDQDYSQDTVTSLKSVLKDMVNARDSNDLGGGSAIDPSPYPLTFNATIDGIEGLEFGDTFTSSYLPKRYQFDSGLRLVFTLVKYEHVFKENDWSTSMECVSRIVDTNNRS